MASAIIAGAGASTGAAVARMCAARGLAVHGARRRPPPQQSGDTFTVSAVDFRDEESVEAFVARVEESSGPVALGVHNIGANVQFSVADTTPQVFRKTWELAALSSLHFARALGARMASRGEGTLIFTGATASLRGAASFSAFAAAMHAKRALAQSLARELGPQGVHVAHVVIDGPVDTPFVRQLLGEEKYGLLKQRGGLLEPDAIAEHYWALHQQPKSAWSFESDLRPYAERW
ncbi:hypothetical protein EMIHUDRAFT_351545 [Emiliania huxleyi CCMP1516]|jgi:NAD(P)-dependent dehydrogenase (short-subunit alcohol dehydrogenase family)|uniref:Short-chain dehydrogenase n=2 Tax=Emiliania huxleyi TaxID=2903 RepID=A0A0D3KDR6_EMIH1|nr:hypothetical protein EMIHUDRAFT_373405 [Emiliania huxleyi CCMP1516]XP_005792116.1 hypothetical protein EMIHUDRAFT_351545 [Emiliania huxleyi CCMP1516]EOD33901.1 hypothetical protein EMIHUDRAFT_373405 [Emiliania huxleyi CCMP1516]EOD39687.1 hypothetical protein EMIHUDRAFT_351545 [Emiliania huxleyi CCMP1516]|eukprot:XP_005786330.1 hypothetical protein EMIHUDRAFT_373405 [Emiliania huxleyi CCMP1516]